MKAIIENNSKEKYAIAFAVGIAIRDLFCSFFMRMCC